LQSTFFELREQHHQLYEQILKDHKKDCLRYEEEIERLHEIIRVKDAYLICISGILVAGDKFFMDADVFIAKFWC
jgi:hypothetical protein